MSAASDAIIEIDAALAALAPQHEGLRDYDRLNLIPEAHAVVQTAINAYDVRVLKLEQAKQALEALVGDGHPEMPARDVVQTVYADLQANKQTIDAALGIFHAVPDPATGFTFASGSPEPKP